MNIRIIHFGSKLQDGEIPETMFCRIVMPTWLVGPYCMGDQRESRDFLEIKFPSGSVMRQHVPDQPLLIGRVLLLLLSWLLLRLLMSFCFLFWFWFCLLSFLIFFLVLLFPEFFLTNTTPMVLLVLAVLLVVMILLLVAIIVSARKLKHDRPPTPDQKRVNHATFMHQLFGVYCITVIIIINS